MTQIDHRVQAAAEEIGRAHRQFSTPRRNAKVGSPTASRQKGPRRTVHASFPRTRLAHSMKRLADAGLAESHKPFAHVTSLIHPIAETRALNRSLPVSLKLPCSESQMLVCDNCTTRKSAPFQVGAKLEPLCDPLQAAFRFFHILIPASPTALLTVCLPRSRCTGIKAKSRAYHVPILADPNAPGPIRLASVFPPVALAPCVRLLVVCLS